MEINFTLVKQTTTFVKRKGIWIYQHKWTLASLQPTATNNALTPRVSVSPQKHNSSLKETHANESE